MIPPERSAFPFLLLLIAFSFAPAVSALDQANQPGRQSGSFLIESNPSPAEVTIDGLFIGESPLNYPVSPSSIPPHTITVSKTGYYPWTTTYPGNPQPGETIRFLATLEPSTAVGTLTVTSSPPGALITVDGGSGQQAPWTYRDIRAGSHVVQAFLSGYQPFTSLVDVPPGGTTSVHAQLATLADVGSLQVKSTPGGADVYIEGIFKGFTATTIGNLAAGEHFIILKLAGYQDWTGTVTVKANQVTILDVPLQVKSARTTGDVEVVSIPPGASVSLDGVFQGVTQAGNPLDITGISPGSHTVLLRLENYKDATFAVEVRAGEISPVNATLIPVSSPGGSGAVQVSSDPAGASVLVDNAFQGITPLTIPSLPSGNHSLLIRMDGYQDYQSSLSLSPGQAIQVQVSLSPSGRNVPLSPAGAALALGLCALLILARRGRPPRPPE